MRTRRSHRRLIDSREAHPRDLPCDSAEQSNPGGSARWTTSRRSRPGVLALAALALGGAAIAGATGGGDESDRGDGDGELSAAVEKQAGTAALKSTGGGTVGQIERDGEKGATYEGRGQQGRRFAGGRTARRPVRPGGHRLRSRGRRRAARATESNGARPARPRPGGWTEARCHRRVALIAAVMAVKLGVSGPPPSRSAAALDETIDDGLQRGSPTAFARPAGDRPRPARTELSSWSPESASPRFWTPADAC